MFQSITESWLGFGSVMHNRVGDRVEDSTKVSIVLHMKVIWIVRFCNNVAKMM